MTIPYIIRPDGLKFSHIEIYRETKSFSGTVTDTAGNPLDGAIVKLKKASKTYPPFTITGSDGKYVLKVDKNFSRYISAVIDKGFSGALPQLKAQPASTPPNPTDTYKVVYSVESPQQFVSRGKTTLTFTPGNVSFFICDASNYGSYAGGSTFDAFEIAKETSSATGSFVLPTDGKWYIVISNEDKARAAEAISVTVNLCKKR